MKQFCRRVTLSPTVKIDPAAMAQIEATMTSCHRLVEEFTDIGLAALDGPDPIHRYKPGWIQARPFGRGEIPRTAILIHGPCEVANILAAGDHWEQEVDNADVLRWKWADFVGSGTSDLSATHEKCNFGALLEHKPILTNWDLICFSLCVRNGYELEYVSTPNHGETDTIIGDFLRSQDQGSVVSQAMKAVLAQVSAVVQSGVECCGFDYF